MTIPDLLWHSMSSQEALSQLKTSIDGLHQNEALERKKIYGPNCLATHKRQNVVFRFLRQFNNILIYILIASAVITIYLGKGVDTSVILGVIILNAIFGFIQEGKAEKALEGIRKMLAPTANIIRDGDRMNVLASSLVPGDIVLLQSGDKVPADLRLIEVKNLKIQESILTGESLPVEKSIQEVSAEVVLGDRTSMAYSGTMVIYGKGIGVVTATGKNTEIGKIEDILAKITVPTTPLLNQINTFGYWLTLCIVILAAITYFAGVYIWHGSSSEMFLGIVGLTVAAVPEGLPPILTIILAIGVTRMAKRNAIIRRLQSVETMGSVSTICTDKTGTLTYNELSVQVLITRQHVYQVSGNFGIVGEILFASSVVNLTEHPDLKNALLASVLCNDAEATEVKDTLKFHGDPVDVAFFISYSHYSLT